MSFRISKPKVRREITNQTYQFSSLFENDSNRDQVADLNKLMEKVPIQPKEQPQGFGIRTSKNISSDFL